MPTSLPFSLAMTQAMTDALDQLATPVWFNDTSGDLRYANLAYMQVIRKRSDKAPGQDPTDPAQKARG